MMENDRNPEEIESAATEEADAVRDEELPADTSENDTNGLPAVSPDCRFSLQLPFQKVADTSGIISGWQKEWNDGYPGDQVSAEPWRFHSSAFLPGNRLALLFEMDEEAYDGHVAVSHVLNRFRVLVYDLGSMEIVQRFAFHSQDMEVLTVLSTPDREGIQAVVRVSGREKDTWTVLPMVPENDGGQFKIAPYVKQVLQFPNGGIAASYTHNDLDPAKTPVAFWAPKDGHYAGGLRAPEDLECAALAIDKNGHVWAHLMPTGSIERLEEEKRTFRSVYQGFSAFGLTSDERLMAVSWQGGVSENRMKLMYRKGDSFEAFGKLDFSNLPGREDPLECSAFGSPVFWGSRFVFNKDGVLYLFDLDRAAEIWM